MISHNRLPAWGVVLVFFCRWRSQADQPQLSKSVGTCAAMPADIPAAKIAVIWLFDNTTEKLNDSLKSPEEKLRLGRGQYVIERLRGRGNLKDTL
jgi:hypothetical protein